MTIDSSRQPAEEPEKQSDQPEEHSVDVGGTHADVESLLHSTSLEDAVRQAGFKDIESAKRALRIAEAPVEAFMEKGELPPGGTESFTQSILSKAGKGEPGLTVGKKQYGRFGPQIDIVYRGPDGMPVARAEVLAEVDPIMELIHNTIKITGWKVKDFATDKSKGILSARAAYAIGEELVKMDALRQSSSISPDALRLMHGYFSRQVAKLSAHVRGVLREQK